MSSDFLPTTILNLLFFTVLRVMANSEFAEFKCQEEVSVCKNKKVEIICSSTLDFYQIELYLCYNRTDKGKLLFNMTTVGESEFQEGQHLQLKKQEATMVIQNTQFSHHGLYRWILLSKGSTIIYTRLYVSEPPTISKENGSLICRASVEKPGRRIIWSNDLSPRPESTSHPKTRGLFKLSSSQAWNDSFDINPPCCKVVDEKGTQEPCEETCYTNSIMCASMNKHEIYFFITIISVLILTNF